MPSSAVQTCARSEEHTSELQSHSHLVCRLLLEKKRGQRESDPLEAAVRGDVRRAGIDRGRIPTPVAAAGVNPIDWRLLSGPMSCFFFFNDTGTPELYPLALLDALPN